MLTIGLAEAQEKLGSLVELAEAGEVVCIMRRGKQVAQITAIAAPRVMVNVAPRAPVNVAPRAPADVEALPRWTAPAAAKVGGRVGAEQKEASGGS
jgi:antitoxin (DNA-binding transcriptional repressor) of toxin-antitoxin stability system